MAELNIPDDILENFRCSICKHYLSSAPVQILPNGNSVCSLCAPSVAHASYRQLALEALLSKLSFPCQFKEFGCGKRMSFGQTGVHEKHCDHRSFICLAPSNAPCPWVGSAMQVPEHFAKEHSELIKTKSEFQLQVDQDREETFIATLDGVCLIVKYMYNAVTSNLQYDVRYFPSNVQEISYKIQLTNDLDQDYSSTVKGGACLLFDPSFYNMSDVKTLILNNYMRILDNPDRITVAVKAAVSKSDSGEMIEQLTVDYDLLRSLRCQKCRSYLIPPLFDGPDGVVCCRCRTKFHYIQPLQNNELNERVAKANFPCRWRNCEFIGKAEYLLQHESACRFRIFNCRNCESIFRWENALSHIQSHGYEYFTDKYVYKMVFNVASSPKKMFTFKYGEIIFIKYHTEFVDESNANVHDLCLDSTGSCSYNSEIKFEHAHCKIKSETFRVRPPGAYFMIDDLPPCFKSDEELTATMKV